MSGASERDLQTETRDVPGVAAHALALEADGCEAAYKPMASLSLLSEAEQRQLVERNPRAAYMRKEAASIICLKRRWRARPTHWPQSAVRRTSPTAN